MRQLVTLNARSREQGEYLNTIMMILNDIQEKQRSSEGQISANALNDHEFEQIYKILPVSNQESLDKLQHTLTTNNILHDKTVCT